MHQVLCLTIQLAIDTVKRRILFRNSWIWGNFIFVTYPFVDFTQIAEDTDAYAGHDSIAIGRANLLFGDDHFNIGDIADDLHPRLI